MEKSSRYTNLGTVPELRYVLLKDNRTGKVEAWTRSRGIGGKSVIIQGVELEFVRQVQCAYRVPDNEFNRINVPDDIGRIYVDQAPANALVQELK